MTIFHPSLTDSDRTALAIIKAAVMRDAVAYEALAQGLDDLAELDRVVKVITTVAALLVAGAATDGGRVRLSNARVDDCIVYIASELAASRGAAPVQDEEAS
jgi:hypothetical protein